MEETERYVRAVELADWVCREFQSRLERGLGLKEPLKSTLCSEIQRKIYGRSFNLRDKVERDAFLEAGGHGDLGCPKVFAIAAEVAAEALLRLMGGYEL